MAFWRTKAFKELQSLWYRKLGFDGFEDAEKVAGDDMALRAPSNEMCRKLDNLEIETKTIYYSLLTERIASANFANDIDRLILTWYAEGERIRDICEELEKLGMRRTRGSVRFIIRRYEMAWGMREYTLKQLNRVG